MNQEHTILVVDDEPDVVAALESMLGDRGYSIRQATRWTDAIAEIQDHRPDAVMLDLYLPTVQGEALLEFIRDLDPNLPVVIVSSEIEPSKLDQLGKLGANGFVRKPFSEDDLFLVVEQILSQMGSGVTEQAETKPPPVKTAPPDRSASKSARVDPGSGVERLERDRPEIESAPARRSKQRSTKRRGKRKGRLRTYTIAFLICLFGTWMLFMAKDMFSQGFFGIDISDTREEK